MENKKYDAELTHLFAHHSVAESTPYEVLDKAYSEYGHTVCVLALYQLLTTGRELIRAMEHPAALVETITGVFPPDVKESAAEVMLLMAKADIDVLLAFVQRIVKPFGTRWVSASRSFALTAMRRTSAPCVAPRSNIRATVTSTTTMVRR